MYNDMNARGNRFGMQGEASDDYWPHCYDEARKLATWPLLGKNACLLGSPNGSSCSRGILHHRPELWGNLPTRLPGRRVVVTAGSEEKEAQRIIDVFAIERQKKNVRV